MDRQQCWLGLYRLIRLVLFSSIPFAIGEVQKSGSSPLSLSTNYSLVFTAEDTYYVRNIKHAVGLGMDLSCGKLGTNRIGSARRRETDMVLWKQLGCKVQNIATY